MTEQQLVDTYNRFMARRADDEGPEFSDCATAAHLRECGFCRAVIWQIAAEQTAAVAEVVQKARSENRG
jgi:hypothetical protein